MKNTYHLFSRLRANMFTRLVHGLSCYALLTSSMSPVWAAAPLAPAALAPSGLTNTGLNIAGNGVPIVNIAAPNAQGTSYNHYTSLNVGPEGLILNNATAPDISQLGGKLYANPNLTNKSANLILNEVSGNTGSNLNGALEVFGNKADVVIANPNGITCDGCGFINVGRATLGTGALTFDANGRFSGVKVSGGDVTVQGQGLLAGNVDYFDIVAGAAHINAALYAKDVVISAGNQSFDYAKRSASAGTGGTAGVVIDSRILGGMYANRILLVGNGTGVGVNLAGPIASLQGPINISSDGDIRIGTLSAASDAQLSSGSGAVTLTDQTYAGGNLIVNAGTGVSQTHGFAGALGDVRFTANTSITLAGLGAFAGLDTQGSVSGGGNLSLVAGQGIDALSATLAAGGDVTLGAQDFNQTASGHIAGNNIHILAQSGTLNAAGTLSAVKSITLNGDVLNLSGALSAGTNIQASGTGITLSGTTGANDTLNLSAGDMLISGTATGLNGVNALASNSLTIAPSGTVQTQGQLSLAAYNGLDVRGSAIGGAGVSLAAASLNISGNAVSGGDILLSSLSDTSLSGVVQAHGALRADIGGMANISGTVAGNGDVVLGATSLNISGTVASNSNLGLVSYTDSVTSSSAKLITNGALSFGTKGSLTADGLLSAQTSLSIEAGTLNLIGTAQTQGTLRLSTDTGSLTLSGTAVTNGSAYVASAQSFNLMGTVSAAQSVSTAAQDIYINSGARLLAGGKATLFATNSMNNGGVVSGGYVGLVGESVLNAGAPVGCVASSTRVCGGVIISSGDMVLSATGAGSSGAGGVFTQDGLVQAGGSLSVQGDAVVLNGASYGALNAPVAGGVAPVVTITGGRVTLGGLSDVESGGALNVRGTATSGTSVMQAGTLVSVGALSVSSGADMSLVGRVSGNGAVTLAATGGLRDSGRISSGGNLNVSAGSITSSGTWVSSGTLSATASNGLSLSGSLGSIGALSLSGASVTSSATVRSNDVLTLTADSATLMGVSSGVNGVVAQVSKDLTLSATGSLQSGNGLSLQAGSLDVEGVLGATGTMGVTSGALVEGKTGQIVAGGTLNVTASGFDIYGVVQGNGGLGLVSTGTGANKVQVSGSLGSGGDLSLTAAGDVTLLGSVGVAGNSNIQVQTGTLQIGSAGQSNSSGGSGSGSGSGGGSSGGSSSGSSGSGSGSSGSSSGSSGSSSGSSGSSSGSSGSGSSSGSGGSAAPMIPYAPAGGVSSNGTTNLSAQHLLIYGSLFSGKALVVNAGDMNVTGVVRGNDAVTLNAQGSNYGQAGVGLVANGALALSGVVQAQGALSLNAGNAVLANGASLVTGDALTLNVQGLSSGAGLQSVKDISITSLGDARITGSLVAGTVDASNTITSMGNVGVHAGGALSFTGNGSATGNLVLSGGALALGSSDTSNGASVLPVPSQFVSMGDIRESGTSLTSAGAWVANGGFAANISGNSVLGGSVRGIQGVTVTSTGTVTQNADIASNGTIALTGTQGFSNSGNINTQADVRISGAGLSFTGTAASGSAGTSSYVPAEGQIVAGDVRLTSAGGVNIGQNAQIYGGNTALVAQGRVALVAQGDVTIAGVLGATNGVSTTIGGGLSIAQSGVVQAGTSDAAGNVTNMGTMSLAASTGIINAGVINTTGSLVLNSPSFTQTHSGILVTGTDFNLSAQTLSVDGSIVSRGSINAQTTQGGFDLLGSLQGLNVTLGAMGGDLNLHQGSSVIGYGLASNAQGLVTLTSSGNIAALGTIAGNNDIHVTAGNSITIGADTSSASGTVPAVLSHGNVSLGAGGNITNQGSVQAGGDITLGGAGLSSQNLLANGRITGSFTGAVQLNGVTDGATGVALATTGAVPSSATLSIAQNAQVLSNQNISLSATGDMNNAGLVSAGVAATGSIAATPGNSVLSTQGKLTSTGGIYANGGGNVTLSGTSLELSGQFAQGGGVYASGSLNLHAPIVVLDGQAQVVSNQDMSYTGNALTLGVGSQLASNGTMHIMLGDSTSPGSYNSSGTLSGLGNVSLSVIGGTLSNALGAGLYAGGSGGSQNGGNLTLSANNISNAGVIYAATSATPTTGLGNISITSPSLTTTGLIHADSNLSLNVDSLSLDGSANPYGANHNGMGTLQANGSLSLLGADTLSPAQSLTITNGGTLQANTLTAYANTISNGGVVSAQNTLALTSNSGISSSGLIISNGSLNLLSNGLIDLQAGSSTQAQTNLHVTGNSINANGLVQAHSTNAPSTNTITLTANAGALNIGGVVDSGGSLNATASGALNITSSATLTGGTGISAQADTITIANNSSAYSLQSLGAINLASQHGLSDNGSIVASGNVSLHDATFINLGASSLISSGTVQATPALTSNAITLSAPTLTALGQIGTTGALNINADSVTLNGTASSNGTVTLAGYTNGSTPSLNIGAGGSLVSWLGNVNLGSLSSFTNNGLVEAANSSDATGTNGNITLTSGSTTIASTGRIIAGHDLNLTTSSGGTLNVAGQMAALHNMNLTNGVLMLSPTGSISANNDLNFTTNDSMTGTGVVQLNGTSYNMAGTPISAFIQGKVTAGHDLNLAMPGQLLVDSVALLAANDSINVSAGNAIITAQYSTQAGAPVSGIVAGNDVNLHTNATGNYGTLLDGGIVAGNNLNINATGEVFSTTNAKLVVGNILSVKGSALALNGNASALYEVDYTATGNTPGTATRTPGSITLGGSTVSGASNNGTAYGGIIRLNGKTATLTTTGALTTKGQAVDAGLAPDNGANANIDIETQGDIINKGNIVSNGTVFVTSSNGNVTNAGGSSGGITGSKDLIIEVKQGAFNNVSGSFYGNNIGLYLGGDFNNTGTVTSTGNLLLSAPNISNTGLIGAGNNLELDVAGNIYNSGTLYAGNGLTLNAGATLTNDYMGDTQGNGTHGLILSGGNLAITAHDIFNSSATIQSLGGNVAINLTGGNLTNSIKTLAITNVPGTGLQAGIYAGGGWPLSYCGTIRVLNYTQAAEFTCTPAGLVSYDGYIRSCGFNGHGPGDIISGFGSACQGFNATFGGTGFWTNGSAPDTTASSNTGTSTIAAAGNVTISAGAGTVTNQNSAITAGGNISISAGTINNIADLLVKNVTANGTTTVTNTNIAGAPTLIQAGGNVVLNAGAGGVHNIVNNLVEADTFTGAMVAQNSAPSAPSQTTPATTGTGGSSSASASNVGAVQTTVESATTGGTATNSAGSGNSNAGGSYSAVGSGQGGTVATTGNSGTGAGNLHAVQSTVSLAINGLTASTQSAGHAGSATTPQSGTPGNGSSASLGAAGTATGAKPGTIATGINGSKPLTVGLTSGAGTITIPGVSGNYGTLLGNFLSSFNLGTPASLFTINVTPGSGTLFSTNSAFAASVAQCAGAVSPATGSSMELIGDCFFQQNLIDKQISAATGLAQLPEYGSSLDQYEGLLANAASAQSALGLNVGVALTPDQVARITQPLVWEVSEQVNGQEVLVPVVYLPASQQNTSSAGPVITGNAILTDTTGSITNSGTIAGQNIVRLNASGDIVNATGGIIEGGAVIADAAHDVVLQGGSSLSGNLVAVRAGNDISTSTTQSFSYNSNSAGASTSSTITGASINSLSGTVLNAGNDIKLDAASLNSGGFTSLYASNSLSMGGEQNDVTQDNLGNGNAHSSSQNFIGTSISAAGPISLAAQNGSLGITGGTIRTLTQDSSGNAGAGDISLYGGAGIEIGAGENTSTSSSFQAISKGYKTTATATTSYSLATIDAADTLNVNTPSALNVKGGNLETGVAGANGTLTGGGDVNINAASVNVQGVIDTTDTSTYSYQHKSGFLSSRTTITSSTSVQEQVQGSTLSGENVRITTTGDQTYLGSTIAGSTDVDLTSLGGNITAGTMQQEDSATISTFSKKSGFFANFTGGINIGYSSTKNTTTVSSISTTNVGTLIGTTSGDINIVADKAVTITGSNVVDGSLNSSTGAFVAGGNVILEGQSITINDAINKSDTLTNSKTSSWGITLGLSSSLLSGVEGVAQAGQLVGDTSNSRVQMVAGAAGALGAYNSYTALNNAATGIKKLGDNYDNLGKDLKAVGASVSLGFNMSTSNSSENDAATTSLGSTIMGNNVTLIATGSPNDPASGVIGITGSRVNATNNLTLSATGDIDIVAGKNTTNSSGNSASSGFGVKLTYDGGWGGALSANEASGKSNGASTTWLNSQLTAGGTATITTPSALLLQGADLNAHRVEINAGSMSLISLQDSATTSASNQNAGLSISASESGTVSGNVSAGMGNSRSSFLSVEQQTGIYAGTGGFGIDIAGNTNLVGGVIASQAPANDNSLTTGTLSVSNLKNSESYSANQTSGSIGLTANLGSSFDGTNNDKTGSDQDINKAANDNPNAKAKNLPGLATDIGTVSAGAPVALNASGAQASTTYSAIAAGDVTLTGGDAASQAALAATRRDTSGTTNALTNTNTANLATAQQGFAAATLFSQQMTTTISTLNAKQQDAQDKADAATKAAIDAGAKIDPSTGGLLNSDDPNVQKLIDNASEFQSQADDLGAQTRVLQALGGAVGNNVTGSLGSLAQSTLANVAQSFGVQQIKTIADSFGETAKDANGKELTNPDGTKIFKPTETSEAVRTALQGLAACAGQAAGGGECSSAALGAASSVVLNNLFATGPGGNAALHPDGSPLTPDEQTERANLVSTLVATLTTALGGDANAATTSAIIETLNNATYINYKDIINNKNKIVNGGWSTEGIEIAYKACAAKGDKYCLKDGLGFGSANPSVDVALSRSALMYALRAKYSLDTSKSVLIYTGEGAPSEEAYICDQICEVKAMADYRGMRKDLADRYLSWKSAHGGQQGSAEILYDIHVQVWNDFNLPLDSLFMGLGDNKTMGIGTLIVRGYKW
jgi:filamentous hemagglutinin